MKSLPSKHWASSERRNQCGESYLQEVQCRVRYKSCLVPQTRTQVGSLPRGLHLLTELVELLLLQLCHDSVESVDLRGEQTH